MIFVKNGCISKKVKIAVSGMCLFIASATVSAAAADEVSLPEPQIQQGMSVMQALEKRQTSRNFSEVPLTSAQLSHILWAANGMNRPGSEGRTVPVAMGVHSIDVYAVTTEGIFLYQPKTHSLHCVAEGDFRMATTKGQAFVGKAPLTLVYVADAAQWQNARHVPTAEKQAVYDIAAAGAMVQSVGLVAAAEGLGTCVRGSIDHDAFRSAARLEEGQSILLAQTIGALP